MSKPMRTVFEAVGCYLPDRELTSREIEQRVGTGRSQGWLEHTTGVRARRIAEPSQSGAELAAAAVRDLLSRSDLVLSEIDCIIYGAALPDVVEPATAHILQALLRSHAAVFDVSNACNGFLTGVQIADAFIRTGTYRCVLIAAGEKLTSAIPWHLIEGAAEPMHHVSALTVGDGAGAALLTPAGADEPDDRGLLAMRMVSDSSVWRACTLVGRGSLDPEDRGRDYLICNAKPLFEASIRHGRDLLDRVLAEAGWHYDDVDLIVPHQVSLQMLELLTAAFGRGVDLAINTFPEYGNVAAANLPIALDAARRSGRLQRGMNVLLGSGAAGLSLGFAAVRW
jgi:3-oxoacyl-[acyl-carrier-protein] synthase III